MVYIFEKHFLTCKVYTILIQRLKHKLKSHTAISIKVVHEQSGKVKYERERLLGTALKIH